MKEKISIVAMSSVSALGENENEIWENYRHKVSLITKGTYDKFSALRSEIQKKHWNKIQELRNVKNYKDLDSSVLLAIYTARKAFENSSWGREEFGINIGSSRGATSLFEKYFKEFTESEKGQVSTLDRKSVV